MFPRSDLKASACSGEGSARGEDDGALRVTTSQLLSGLSRSCAERYTHLVKAKADKRELDEVRAQLSRLVDVIRSAEGVNHGMWEARAGSSTLRGVGLGDLKRPAECVRVERNPLFEDSPEREISTEEATPGVRGRPSTLGDRNNWRTPPTVPADPPPATPSGAQDLAHKVRILEEGLHGLTDCVLHFASILGAMRGSQVAQSRGEGVRDAVKDPVTGTQLEEMVQSRMEWRVCQLEEDVHTIASVVARQEAVVASLAETVAARLGAAAESFGPVSPASPPGRRLFSSDVERADRGGWEDDVAWLHPFPSRNGWGATGGVGSAPSSTFAEFRQSVSEPPMSPRGDATFPRGGLGPFTRPHSCPPGGELCAQAHIDVHFPLPGEVTQGCRTSNGADNGPVAEDGSSSFSQLGSRPREVPRRRGSASGASGGVTSGLPVLDGHSAARDMCVLCRGAIEGAYCPPGRGTPDDEGRGRWLRSWDLFSSTPDMSEFVSLVDEADALAID